MKSVRSRDAVVRFVAFEIAITSRLLQVLEVLPSLLLFFLPVVTLLAPHSRFEDKLLAIRVRYMFPRSAFSKRGFALLLGVHTSPPTN